MSQIADAEFGSLEDGIRKVLVSVFRSFLPNLRFGAIDHQQKAENFAAFYVSSTTSSTANDEFSVQHGMGRVPTYSHAVMPLNVVGARNISLKVTRAADAQRVYLSSPDTAAPFFLYVE